MFAGIVAVILVHAPIFKQKRILHEDKKGVNKIKSDIEKGCVQLTKVDMTNEEHPVLKPIVVGIGVGVNTYGIFTSCTNFLNNLNDASLARFGYGLSGIGCAIGAYQTIIAFSDGDISTADMLTNSFYSIGGRSTRIRISWSYTDCRCSWCCKWCDRFSFSLFYIYTHTHGDSSWEWWPHIYIFQLQYQ